MLLTPNHKSTRCVPRDTHTHEPYDEDDDYAGIVMCALSGNVSAGCCAICTEDNMKTKIPSV